VLAGHRALAIDRSRPRLRASAETRAVTQVTPAPARRSATERAAPFAEAHGLGAYDGMDVGAIDAP